MRTVLVCAALLLSGCVAHREEGPVDIVGDVRADLSSLRTMKVFFGHQSVGGNLLQGLQEIARSQGDSVAIVALSGNGAPFVGGIEHSLIGRNQDPGSKCDDFVAIVRRIAPEAPDIVAMKFCYVDFDENTDPRAVFDRYRVAVENVRKVVPSAKILHITSPLTARTPGWKRIVKGLLGRLEAGDETAKRRAAFNRLLREGFPEDPLFDLARSESTYPDGRRETARIDGTEVEFLVGEFTSDGGHLSERGRSQVSRELLHVLATAKGR